MKKFIFILKRDLLLANHLGSLFSINIFFFFLIIFIFSISIGPDLVILWRFGFSILWVGILFTSVLSLESLFQTEKHDGSLELLFLSPVRFEFIILSKTLSHWFTCGFPLICLWPFLSLFLGNPFFNDLFSVYTLFNYYNFQLTLIFFFGTFILSFLGTIGSALTVGLKQRGILLLLILVPLYIPVLIFGISSMNSILLDLSTNNLINITSIKSEFLFLHGFFILIIIVSPWLSSQILYNLLD